MTRLVGAGGRRWAVVSAASGTVLIAAGAFWLSFTALADLARRSGISSGQAWIWPLLVDGLIVVSTVAVVALDGRRAAWYPGALLICGALVSVAANAIHAIVTADADVPALLAASVAAVPPVVLLASTHLTVVLIRSTRTDPVPEPDAPATAHPLAIAELLPLNTAGEADEQVAESSVEESARRAVSPVERVSQRVEAARLRGEGWSNKRIAQELTVHPSTVGRWFATDASEIPEDRRER